MDVVSALSPTLWDLLMRTRVNAELALELFDENLNPLLPASEDPRCVVLRRAVTVRFHAGSELSFRTVLQSGREARMTTEGWELTLLPVRDNQQPVALLAAVTGRTGDRPSDEWVPPGYGEATARAWRDAIAGDLLVTRRLRLQEELTHRSRALATFVADLQQCSGETELLNMLLQAIAVWHDVEACAYARNLGGQFTVRATLPGVDVSSLPASLEAGAVTAAIGWPAGEWPVLTPVGWRGKGTPLLMLVSSGSLEEWLIAISGTHDTDLSEQLQPMLRGFSTAMERVREREVRKLRQQLWDALVAWSEPADVSGLGREVLTLVARAVDGAQGVLKVESGRQSPASASVIMGEDSDTSLLVRDGLFSADALRISLTLGDGRVASLEFRRAGGGCFLPQHVTILLGVRPFLGSWLSSVGAAGEWSASVGPGQASRDVRSTDSDPSA